MSQAPTVELSVVVPTYGCAPCLHALHERLARTLARMGVEYELVFVDDGATDGSWDVLQQLAAGDRHIRAYRLSRNFGQHMAITAGIARSSGRWIVVMDCDLQDPPEQIPRLYAKALVGHEVVFARRLERPGSVLRRAAGELYFRLLNLTAGTDIDRSYGTFSIISRKVADAFLEFRDRDRHYLFILYWLGFNHSSIEFAYADRHSGQSAYGLRQLLGHALDGLVFQTTVLLRWIAYAGFALASAGALLAAYIIVVVLTGSTPPGWASLAIFSLLLSGFVITSSGIIGLYVGKMFEQVKERPMYVVADAIEPNTPTNSPQDSAEPGEAEAQSSLSRG
ncbi:MAG: glycosyltransferase family 2 protein [Solirubrobacteraceae bacterium]